MNIYIRKYSKKVLKKEDLYKSQSAMPFSWSLLSIRKVFALVIFSSLKASVVLEMINSSW